MKLQDQVINLSQAKKLKELGVKQESLFYIAENDPSCIFAKTTLGYTTFGCESPSGAPSYWEDTDGYEYYSAFTVAELGVMLDEHHCDAWCEGMLWYTRHEGTSVIMWATEAEAMVYLLIKLLETDTITISEVNERLLK